MPAGTRRTPGLREFVMLPAAALAVVLGTGAQAAEVGGTYWPAIGTSKVNMKKSGFKPLEVPLNLRLDFDGSSADAAGAGVCDARDAVGHLTLANIPFTWETGKGAAFKTAMDTDALTEFLEGRITVATNKETVVTLTSMKCKGAVVRKGAGLKYSVAAAGTVTLDGGGAFKLKWKGKVASAE